MTIAASFAPSLFDGRTVLVTGGTGGIGRAVRVSSVFPGVVDTDVFRNARWVPRPLRAVVVALQRRIGAAPADAVRTPVFLADDPAAEGGFYGPELRRLPIPERARRPDRRAALRTAADGLIQPVLNSRSR